MAPGSERRLAAIMFTDIVGYTALMARDEEAGRRARDRHEAVVRLLVERYHGEWIERTGDETLSSFPSAVDGVNCALAIQAALDDESELRVRIGIHVGDVVVSEGSVHGDGVNIASRIRPGPSPAASASRMRYSTPSSTSGTSRSVPLASTSSRTCRARWRCSR